MNEKKLTNYLIYGGGALIALLVLLLYFSTLGYQFLNWDDDWLIIENNFIKSFSAINLYHLLLDFSRQTRMILGAEYLPVFDLSLMFDSLLWGERASGFHLTNLLIYLASCLLFYRVLVKMVGRPLLPLLAVLIFASHPAHLESVAWISDRRSLLALFFMLLSFSQYQQATAAQKIDAARLYLSLLAFLLAGLSKQFAVVMPLLIVAYEIIIREKTFFVFLKERQKTVYLFFLLSAVLIALHLSLAHLVQMFSPRAADGFYLNALFSLNLFKHFFLLLIFPYTTAVFLKIADPALPTIWQIISSLTFFCLFFAFFIYSIRRYRFLAFALAWFVICLLPFLQITPVENWLTWRYLYASSAALSLAILQLSSWSTLKNSKRSLLTIAMILPFIFFYTVQSYRALPQWSDSENFWLFAIENDLKFDKAYVNLSKYYLDRGEKEKSLKIAKLYARQFPRSLSANQLLALRFFQNQQMTEGREQTARALEIDAQAKEVYNNWAKFEIEQRNYAEAIAILDKALAIDKNYSAALNNRGLIELKQGSLKQAEKYFYAAIKSDKENVIAAFNLATVKYALGKKQSALRILKEILRIDPDNRAALKMLAKINQRQKGRATKFIFNKGQ